MQFGEVKKDVFGPLRDLNKKINHCCRLAACSYYLKFLTCVWVIVSSFLAIHWLFWVSVQCKHIFVLLYSRPSYWCTGCLQCGEYEHRLFFHKPEEFLSSFGTQTHAYTPDSGQLLHLHVSSSVKSHVTLLGCVRICLVWIVCFLQGEYGVAVGGLHMGEL